MTAIPTAQASAPAFGRAPVLVVVAFYLWLPIIIAQSIVLAYMALTLAQAARIGGPAWDVVFVDPPIAISLLLMVTLEVGFAISMRAGGRVGRVVLVLLAVLNATFAFLVGAPPTGTRMPVVQTTAQVLASSVAFDLDLILKVLSVIALTASVLPFLPAASAYFARQQGTKSQAPSESSPSIPVSEQTGNGEPISSPDAEAVRDAETLARRARPWQVIVAFILWWPLVLMQVAALVYLGTTIAYYLGLDMGSVVTVLFIVGVGVPLLGLVAGEIALNLALLRGSRVARWWLLGLAISTLLIAIWPASAVALAEIAGTHGGIGGGAEIATISGIAASVALLALFGTVLTFLAPPDSYFARKSDAVGRPAPSSGPVAVFEGAPPASP